MSTSNIGYMTTQTRTSPDDSATTVILKPEVYRYRVVMPDREFYPHRVVLWSVLMEELKDTVLNHEIYGRHKTLNALAILNASPTSSTIATSSALATSNTSAISSTVATSSASVTFNDNAVNLNA